VQAKSDADDGIQHVCGRRSWHEGRHWRQWTQKRLATAADAVQECQRWSQQRNHGTLSVSTASAWRMAQLLSLCDFFSWNFSASTPICDWFLPRCCNSVDYSETAEHIIRVFCRPVVSHTGIFETNVSAKFWWSGCTESVWVLKHCKIAIFDEYVGLYLCL